MARLNRRSTQSRCHQHAQRHENRCLSALIPEEFEQERNSVMFHKEISPFHEPVP
jgi:hypothetical protein